LIPAFPSVDPSGRKVAYVTVMNSARARLLDRATGVVKDIGPAVDRCAPIWLSSDSLWVAQSIADGVVSWAEIAPTTGEHTGALESAALPVNQDCAVPRRFLQADSALARHHLVARQQETSEIATSSASVR